MITGESKWTSEIGLFDVGHAGFANLEGRGGEKDLPSVSPDPIKKKSSKAP